MSSMGRWHSIVEKKTATNAAKGKIYAKIGKLITIAAREGTDPDLNASLALALQKAKENNLPKHVIEKALSKGSGHDDENLHEIMYEGYGPGGVAMYIKALTSNTNRSASNIRTIVQKHQGSMGSPGSVGWQFQYVGMILINAKKQEKKEKGMHVEELVPYDKNILEHQIVQLPVLDIEYENTLALISTDKNDFVSVRDILQQHGYNIHKSGLEYVPDSLVKISPEEKELLLAMIDCLHEDEDVDTVWHNADI